MAAWDDYCLSYVDANGVVHCTAYGDEEADTYSRIQATAYSPIAIDLDGDGIETSRLTFSETGGVRFDLNGDGVEDRVAWLTGDDAFLVRDLNADGAVNGGEEMFGGASRGEGYFELAGLDENSDGMLNELDSTFQSLLLWKDGNADGITDAGELITLSTAGVTEIGVAYESTEVWDHGNLIGERSDAWLNGVRHDVADVYFAADLGVA